jgi:hypothetical protein
MGQVICTRDRLPSGLKTAFKKWYGVEKPMIQGVYVLYLQNNISEENKLKRKKQWGTLYTSSGLKITFLKNGAGSSNDAGVCFRMAISLLQGR